MTNYTYHTDYGMSLSRALSHWFKDWAKGRYSVTVGSYPFDSHYYATMDDFGTLVPTSKWL